MPAPTTADRLTRLERAVIDLAIAASDGKVERFAQSPSARTSDAGRRLYRALVAIEAEHKAVTEKETAA